MPPQCLAENLFRQRPRTAALDLDEAFGCVAMRKEHSFVESTRGGIDDLLRGRRGALRERGECVVDRRCCGEEASSGA